MNGRTVQQRILHFLTDHPKEAFTRDTIARQVETTPLTAAKELTVLKRSGVIQESNGNWSTTQQGIGLYEANPNFTPFHTREEGPQDGRENWAELLGPEVINNSFSRTLLESPPKEALEQLKPYLPYFVLAWLVAEGIPVSFDPNDIPSTTDTEISNKVIDAFNLLVQEETPKIIENQQSKEERLAELDKIPIWSLEEEREANRLRKELES